MNCIDIGPVPHEENAAQTTDPDFAKKNRAECAAFKSQIVRAYGEPPAGCTLRTIGNPHDFGMYREISVCIGDVNSVEERDAAWDYAYRVESDRDQHLARWDATARVALGMPVEAAA